MLYAGGRQTGAAIELLVMKEVAQSHLTKLWSKDELKIQHRKSSSFLHGISILPDCICYCYYCSILVAI